MANNKKNKGKIKNDVNGKSLMFMNDEILFCYSSFYPPTTRINFAGSTRVGIEKKTISIPRKQLRTLGRNVFQSIWILFQSSGPLALRPLGRYVK